MRSLQPVLQPDVVRYLLLDVGGALPADKTIQRNMVLAEYLRGCLYELSQVEGDGARFASIHSRRLTNAVRQHLKAVWPNLWQNRNQLPFDTEKEEQESSGTDYIRWVLDRLALLGDVAYLGNGYWLPTPIRLIRNPYSGDVAVIGGMATKHLCRLLPGVQIAGYGRLVFPNDLPKWIQEGAEWWQDYRSWAGYIPVDLSVWTEAEVAKITTQGSRSSPTFTDFEVYISDRALQYRIRYSWVSVQELLAIGGIEGVLLCRSGKPFRYFLGKFAAGQLVYERNIPDEAVRWLQLGLCLRGGATPYAIWEGTKLRVYPPLPRALERHLTVYACAFITQAGQTWYHVTPQYQSCVEQFLGRFGYRSRNKGGAWHE